VRNTFGVWTVDINFDVSLGIYFAGDFNVMIFLLC